VKEMKRREARGENAKIQRSAKIMAKLAINVSVAIAAKHRRRGVKAAKSKMRRSEKKSYLQRII